MKLNLANLATIGNSVSAPSYDRADLTPGIVHVGVGNFFRGHQAVYMDDLFNEQKNLDWGIVGAGVSNGASNVRAAMEDQDWLTTVVARDGQSKDARIIGSMVDFVPVDLETHAPLKEALLDPRIKLVTTTVTEGGYYQDEYGNFNLEDPKIVADLQDPSNPKTIFGIFVQALKKRKEAGDDAFSILCCDNVPHGGDVVKGGVLGFATALDDQDLANYIEEKVGFPNAMVDRIVPKTTDMERLFLTETYGFDDEWPIFCEPFMQWVLEDDFRQGRPEFESLDSVLFVEDVGPYELKKLRILNGGHASLCYPAALMGLQYVHDAMENDVIGPFVDCLERHEVIPAVPPVPNVKLGDYWKTIQNRFENPTICDRIDRICAQGSDRQGKFIIPTATDAVKDGKAIDGLALVSAMWCRYCQGVSESGVELPPNDTMWDELQANALKAKDDPKVWLAMHDIYGDLGEHPVFIEAFTKALNMVNVEGVEHAMKEYVKEKE
jgi:mannitol 2-dehydrogenase